MLIRIRNHLNGSTLFSTNCVTSWRMTVSLATVLPFLRTPARPRLLPLPPSPLLPVDQIRWRLAQRTPPAFRTVITSRWPPTSRFWKPNLMIRFVLKTCRLEVEEARSTQETKWRLNSRLAIASSTSPTTATITTRAVEVRWRAMVEVSWHLQWAAKGLLSPPTPTTAFTVTMATASS